MCTIGSKSCMKGNLIGFMRSIMGWGISWGKISWLSSRRALILGILIPSGSLKNLHRCLISRLIGLTQPYRKQRNSTNRSYNRSKNWKKKSSKVQNCTIQRKATWWCQTPTALLCDELRPRSTKSFWLIIVTITIAVGRITRARWLEFWIHWRGEE